MPDTGVYCLLNLEKCSLSRVGIAYSGCPEKVYSLAAVRGIRISAVGRAMRALGVKARIARPTNAGQN